MSKPDKVVEERKQKKILQRQGKIDTFTAELGLIVDDNIRYVVEETLAQLPTYFFEIPASSTGKYHPSYALGQGGLVRHTKAAVQIAFELFRVTSLWWPEFTQERQDRIVAALILHDGVKNGLEGSRYTQHDHPVLLEKYIHEIFESDLQEVRRTAREIAEIASSHMGQWTSTRRSTVILPRPESDEQMFVHMCDYLASRRMLEVPDEYFR